MVFVCFCSRCTILSIKFLYNISMWECTKAGCTMILFFSWSGKVRRCFNVLSRQAFVKLHRHNLPLSCKKEEKETSYVKHFCVQKIFFATKEKDKWIQSNMSPLPSVHIQHLVLVVVFALSTLMTGFEASGCYRHAKRVRTTHTHIDTFPCFWVIAKGLQGSQIFGNMSK